VAEDVADAVWFVADAGDVLFLLVPSTGDCAVAVLLPVVPRPGLGLLRLEKAGAEEGVEGVCFAEANRMLPFPFPLEES
jgi:hypothetical protein